MPLGPWPPQSAVGIYADGANPSTKTASYINVVVNTVLISILIFFDIDKFDPRTDETPFIRNIVSIEEVPYKFLRHCYRLSGYACLGRACVIAMSYVYSVISLVYFYSNDGVHDRADEHVIALAPLSS